MKKILTLLSAVFVFLVAGAFLLMRNSASPHIKKAAQFAAEGNCDKAVSNFASAVIKLAEPRNVPYVPGRVQAQNLNPRTWEKPLADFVEWINTDKIVPPHLAAVLDEIDRCTTGVVHENSMYDIKMKKASLDGYKAFWEDVFSPEKAAGGPGRSPVIEKAFAGGLAVMSLSGNAIYSYDLHFIDRKSGKQTNVTVDCSQTVSFPVKPGQYIIVASSKTMFRGGQEWISGKEAFSFSVPDSANIITALLRTENHRGK
jgi:hypothetical protein